MFTAIMIYIVALICRGKHATVVIDCKIPINYHPSLSYSYYELTVADQLNYLSIGMGNVSSYIIVFENTDN